MILQGALHMLIDYYKAIEDSSRKMLNAAKLEDWEQVVRYEGACAVLIEQLRARAASEMLLPEQQTEKVKIMQRILQNDALIRFLAEPWSEQTARLHSEASCTLH
jgi:flagellar protein FliT